MVEETNADSELVAVAFDVLVGEQSGEVVVDRALRDVQTLGEFGDAGGVTLLDLR